MSDIFDNISDNGRYDFEEIIMEEPDEATDRAMEEKVKGAEKLVEYTVTVYKLNESETTSKISITFGNSLKHEEGEPLRTPKNLIKGVIGDKITEQAKEISQKMAILSKLLDL